MEAKGKMRGTYRRQDAMTPWEKIKSLPKAAHFLEGLPTFQPCCDLMILRRRSRQCHKIPQLSYPPIDVVEDRNHDSAGLLTIQ